MFFVMPAKPDIRRARELRNDMTPPERALWRQLRSEVFKPFHFRRQVPVGPYFADFLSHRMNLVIELDGHTHDVKTDARRDAWFAERGFTTLRFPNSAVGESAEGVAEEILDWLWNETQRRRVGAKPPP